MAKQTSLLDWSDTVVPTPVFRIGNKEIWGGSVYKWTRVPRLSLLINLLGGSYYPDRDPVRINAKGREMLSPKLTEIQVPILSVAWPDCETPPLARAWWHRLVCDIMDRVPEGNVMVGCMGGVGRTGTALSIMACEAGLVPSGADPVAWLRQHYVPDAVETSQQLHYVSAITGRRVDAPPGLFLPAAWLHKPEKK